MHLSKRSRDIMNFFIPYVDPIINMKKSKQFKKNTDSILKVFYYSLKKSNLLYNTMYENNEIYRTLLSYVDSKKVLEHEFIHSQFVSTKTKEFIKNNTQYILKYKFYIEDKPVIVYIGFKSLQTIGKYDKYVKKMIIILHFLNSIHKLECTTPLTIMLFPTPHNKLIPTSELSILGPKNVNSAVTTNCSPDGNSMLIFRNEEWYKVFIHELMHSLNMDFSFLNVKEHDSKLSQRFFVNSAFNSFEAYSEFWATVINVVYCSYEMLGQDNTLEDFIVYYELFMSFEKMFSIFQLVKILDFMNLHYELLYTNKVSKILYKENTNVFSYYILKSILLFNSDKFLFWCYFNNVPFFIKFKPTTEHINEYYEFIENNYRNKKFLDIIDAMQKLYKKQHLKKVNNNLNKVEKYIMNTLTMTVSEM